MERGGERKFRCKRVTHRHDQSMDPDSQLPANRISLIQRSFDKTATVKEKDRRQRLTPRRGAICAQLNGLRMAADLYFVSLYQLFDIGFHTSLAGAFPEVSTARIVIEANTQINGYNLEHNSRWLKNRLPRWIIHLVLR